MSSSAAPSTIITRLRHAGSPGVHWLMGGALLLLVLALLWIGWHSLAFGRWVVSSQQAGQAIDAGMAWPDPRYAYSLPTVRDPAALEQAFPRLEQAHQLRPQEPWPLWQTARIYAAREEWAQAEEFYRAAIQLDPENPLLGWEAGLLSFEQLQGIPTSEGVEPIDLTAQVAAGTLAAPETVVGTPFCAQGSCYSGLSTITRPMADGSVEGDVTAPFLFLHPPAERTQHLDLPAYPTALTFLLGLDPYADRFGTDGATFVLTVTPEEGGPEEFSWSLDAESLLAGWTAAEVSLAPWAGQQVALTFASRAGPSDKSGGDWVGWGAITLAPSFDKEAERLITTMREFWMAAGITEVTLLNRAEEARQAQDLARAERWYLAADTFGETGLSGLHHMQWMATKADGAPGEIDLLERAVAADAGWSSRRQRAEAWNAWGQHLQGEEAYEGARGAYLRALDAYDGVEGAVGTHAAVYRRLAEVQLALGEIDGAVTSYRDSVALDPENMWAQFGLGRSLILQDSSQSNEAQLAFESARALDPENAQLVRSILESWMAVGAIEQVATLCASLEVGLRTEPIKQICDGTS